MTVIKNWGEEPDLSSELSRLKYDSIIHTAWNNSCIELKARTGADISLKTVWVSNRGEDDLDPSEAHGMSKSLINIIRKRRGFLAERT